MTNEAVVNLESVRVLVVIILGSKYHLCVDFFFIYAVATSVFLLISTALAKL